MSDEEDRAQTEVHAAEVYGGHASDGTLIVVDRPEPGAAAYPGGGIFGPDTDEIAELRWKAEVTKKASAAHWLARAALWCAALAVVLSVVLWAVMLVSMS